MTNQRRLSGRRLRVALGASVVGAALGAAGVLGGAGLAGNSVTAAQSQYGKLTICHKTHSRKHPSVTITISASAWPAHLRHGDTAGACGTTVPTTSTTAPTSTSTGIATSPTPSESPAEGPGENGTHGNPHRDAHGGAHGHGHH